MAKTGVVAGWVARVSQAMTSGHQTLQKHVRKKTVGSALISACFETYTIHDDRGMEFHLEQIAKSG